MSGADETEPLSWAWKPLSKFSIDVELCGQHIVTEVDAKDREKVAEGLARLADAVMGQPRRLFWRWEDGAEWDLNNNLTKMAAQSGTPEREPHQ